jgi:predicted O-methyltransferase YrrM
MRFDSRETSDKTSGYIRGLLPESDGFLREIEEYARGNFVPVLLPETARLLSQLIALKKPLKILEIGTAVGCSGIIMLRAAPPAASLHTVEISEQRVNIAKENFKAAGFFERVTLFLNDAAEVLPCLDASYDFIFLDGPKARYLDYLPFLRRLLNSGGVLLCDNVLFSGMVQGEEAAGKKQGLVKRIDAFLTALFACEELDSSVIPLGDGLSLSLKK